MKATQACPFPGCDRPGQYGSLCWGHLAQRRKGQVLRTLQPRRVGCMVADCDRKHVAHGYCQLHYKRFMQTGDPHGLLRILDGTERFESYIDRTETCWLWKGRLDEDGYGHFRQDYKRQGAHRFAYEYHVGAIPKGLVIDHLCRVRHCVKPDHLEPVTMMENFIRGVMAVELGPSAYTAWLDARRSA